MNDKWITITAIIVIGIIIIAGIISLTKVDIEREKTNQLQIKLQIANSFEKP